MKYSLIYADPAWHYDNKASNGAAEDHYGTMKGFTWVKFNPLAEQHINKALQAGGVEDFYDFLDLLNVQTRMNGGNYTRANTEDLLIATRGNGLERQCASIKQVIYSPLGEHSQKPAEARYRLEKLYGDVPRIELFSRSVRLGGTTGGISQYHQM